MNPQADMDVVRGASAIEQDMYTLIEDLYPICRSITGDGVRETLSIIKRHIPLEVHEVPTGTAVFDWTIPEEWNISDAYIKNSKGERVVDFQKSNLHVVNYSIPVKQEISLEDLKAHLFTLPEYPDRIPYLTSYYKEDWGFCLSHNQYSELKQGMYEVSIDSSLKEGHLTFGELYLKGKREEEVLLSCYLCHPSLCNDNLSGISLLTFLAKKLMGMDLEYSYRFLFIPETIGAITWLSLNENNVHTIKHGLVVTCVGDSGALTYKKSRKGDAEIDRIVEKVLKDSGQKHQILDFFPSGSDERQFCSPGFDLPVGSLMRTPYGRFSEYHTSADDLNCVTPEYLLDSFEKYFQAIFILENNRTYLSLNQKCEPQLGRRGLYRMLGSQKRGDVNELAMSWVLNLCDGDHSLLDIAVRASLPFEHIRKAAGILYENGLLEEIK